MSDSQSPFQGQPASPYAPNDPVPSTPGAPLVPPAAPYPAGVYGLGASAGQDEMSLPPTPVPPLSTAPGDATPSAPLGDAARPVFDPSTDSMPPLPPTTSVGAQGAPASTWDTTPSGPWYAPTTGAAPASAQAAPPVPPAPSSQATPPVPPPPPPTGAPAAPLAGVPQPAPVAQPAMPLGMSAPNGHISQTTPGVMPLPPSWGQQPSAPPARAAQEPVFFMDRVAHGRFTNHRWWIAVLRIVAWVILALTFIFGVIFFFVTANAGRALTYGLAGPDYGSGFLVMMMTWIGGSIATIGMMVFTNMADDLNRMRTILEERRP